jgi:hypothetical protein
MTLDANLKSRQYIISKPPAFSQRSLGLLVDRVPGRQVVGHHPPGGSRAGNVAQAVEHFAQRVLAPGASMVIKVK